jgi:ParB family transcriptional regulator, chromosome partitioning protein
MPKTKFKVIPTGEIRESKHHWKREIDPERIEDLGRTIKEVGMLHPITVIKKAKGKGYEYIAGERRFLAARQAGMKTVPCLVQDLDEIAAAEASIYENLQREDMTSSEHDSALRKLVELKKKRMQMEGTEEPVTTSTAVAEVARDAKVSRSTVDRALAVGNLIKEARAAYEDGDITKKQAAKLAAMDKKDQKEELPKMLEETEKESTRRQLAEEAAPSNDGDPKHTKAAVRMFDMVVTRSHELDSLARELRNNLTDEVVLALQEFEHSAVHACHTSLGLLLEDIGSIKDWQARGKR